MLLLLSAFLLVFGGTVDAAPALPGPLASLLSPYAPVSTSCPSSSLVRSADGINSQEATYVSARHSKAASSITSFLEAHGFSSDGSPPVIGFTSSGGGYRALLSTAGVVQAFDARESKLGVSGVYQALTYQAGLSGGSWFLSSLAANNWPTVTYLKNKLWKNAFQNSLLVPDNLDSGKGAVTYARVAKDLLDKHEAGYNVTIIDAWGRLLSYQLLQGRDGGVHDTLSGLTTLSNFTQHNVPYPIITTTIDFPDQDQCYPSITGPIIEFHPYEYGSWGGGINAFASTPYMGTNISAGKPVQSGSCVANYDNIGYVFGTSSDIFNGLEMGSCFTPPVETNDLPGLLGEIVSKIEDISDQDLFGIYPNPFYNYNGSPMVSNLTDLTLSDGGQSDQNNPIFPFIVDARDVDVLIVNDNSADTTDNFPNGTEIYTTYLNAMMSGLSKMPTIPPVSTFVSEGLNKRATFFGCNETGTMFIVYLPNVNYTFPSNEPTSKVEYTIAETNGMIKNGIHIATQNGTEGWPQCLACAIGTKTGGSLPKKCNACFQKYCYYQ